MKRLFLLFIAFLAINVAFAQTPLQFKYQAVLRDANGGIISSQSKTVIISILQGSVTGTSVFTETHNVTTTAQGLINLNIGSVNTTGISTINWAANTYFIKITVDGVEMGTSQLVSVPYALNAKKAETADYNSLTNLPTIPTVDGSETKVIAGTNIILSGTGTIASPYVISSTTKETKIIAGANVVLTGAGTTESPYVITSGCGYSLLPPTVVNQVTTDIQSFFR